MRFGRLFIESLSLSHLNCQGANRALSNACPQISAYLCARNGIDNTLENSSAYIQNWLKALKDDKTMLLKASGKAVAAVKYILNKEA